MSTDCDEEVLAGGLVAEEAPAVELLACLDLLELPLEVGHLACGEELGVLVEEVVDRDGSDPPRDPRRDGAAEGGAHEARSPEASGNHPEERLERGFRVCVPPREGDGAGRREAAGGDHGGHGAVGACVDARLRELLFGGLGLQGQLVGGSHLGLHRVPPAAAAPLGVRGDLDPLGVLVTAGVEVERRCLVRKQAVVRAVAMTVPAEHRKHHCQTLSSGDVSCCSCSCCC